MPHRSHLSRSFDCAAASLREAAPRYDDLDSGIKREIHRSAKNTFDDISHLSKQEQFDNVDQILKSASAKDVFFVPGEHDVLDDNGKSYLERYGKAAQGAGWYSFDKKGVHFIGLVNVMNLKAAGLGSLGGEQLEWMEKDVKHLKHSTPIVVFAHIPLWSVYPDWGGARKTARRRWPT